MDTGEMRRDDTDRVSAFHHLSLVDIYMLYDNG